MASLFKRTVLKPVPYLLTDRGGALVAGALCRSLKKELEGAVTDKFLDFLLKGMDISFCLSRSYRKNIEGFEGSYLFVTADESVNEAVTFKGGNMHVEGEPKESFDWDTRVSFKDAAALREFLFSENQDILNSILKNEVEVDGNLNHIYRFGFLAKDLRNRIGI